MKKNTRYLLIGTIIVVAGILIIRSLLQPTTPVGTIPGISDADWVKGNPTAKIQLVEYSDFQCPGCRQAWSLMKEVEQEFGNDIYFTYRYFPLTEIHKNALASAWAAEAAGKQGKFWEMHDVLFGYQDEWSPEVDPYSKFEKYATGLGIDLTKFKSDYESSDVRNKVATSRQAAVDLKLRGTPSFFLDGTALQPGQDLKTLIRDTLAGGPKK